MSIYTKLNSARDEFHTLKLKKSGLNKFAGYEYFELADFLIPAMKVLSKHELCAFISFGRDLATMKIVDVVDGTSIEITSPMSSAALKGCHEVQNLGAVQSYLRRYLWVAALEIVEHDALDSSEPLKANTAAPVIPATPRTEDLGLTADELNFINEMAEQVRELVATDATAALNLINAAGLEGEQRIALSNMLDSKVRSALKKAKELQPA